MLDKNIQNINLTSLSQKQNIKRRIRDTKHYAPANKEWKNSVYLYNKESLIDAAVKDKRAAHAIKGYFNLVHKPKYVTKSKRMRDLLRHKSTNQFFVSRPEIKQTNDKAIITVYTHDRQKFLYLKKLYFLNRWLNVSNITADSLTYAYYKSDNDLLERYETSFLVSKRLLSETVYNYRYKQINLRWASNIIKKCLLKYRVKYNSILNHRNLILRKKEFISSLLVYHFLKWILSIFRTKMTITCDSDLISIKFKSGKKSKNKVIIEKKITGVVNIKNLKVINLLLIKHIRTINNSVINKNIFRLFYLFKNRYFKVIAKKYMKKEILVMKYLNKLYLNQFKYHSYLPGLKTLLDSIYNKKIQLNIVNLKYLHLNSDLFTEAIAIKLKDRTKGLLGVIIKSFGLVKMFKPNNMFILSEKNKNSVINDINTYFGKYNVINGNVLNVVFKKMFNSRNSKIRDLNSSVGNLITSLKYKWITGIRVEAAGRLTKRYAAARALFKYKYRGSLKNLEHLKNVENKLQSPSLYLLRGEMKPNLQHTFFASKRRIGAFGIKSWISSS